MKISMFFAKPKAKATRAPRRPAHSFDDWTTRDWADLPVHHPRRD